MNNTLSDKKRFQHLLEIQRRLSSERDLNRLAQLVMRDVMDLLEADRSSLFLFDWDIMQLRACFAEGVDPSRLIVPLRMGIMGSAVLSRKTINVTNASSHPHFNPEIDSISGFRTESLLAIPIQTNTGHPLGGLELINKNTGHFTNSDKLIAEKTAHFFSEVIQSGEMTPLFAQRETNTLREQIGYERSAVFLIDEIAGQMIAIHADGLNRNQLTLQLRLGIAGQVAVIQQPLLIQDAHQDQRFDTSFDRRTGYRTKGLLCAPLVNISGETLGVIQAINKKGTDNRFTLTDLETLTSVAGIIAITLDNAMLLREYELQFLSLLETLSASIDAKDTLTAGHSSRVAEIAIGIATIFRYPQTELDILRVAAILHDYGKIGINDAVLKKPGRLDAEEYRHIQQHAMITFDILERIHFARQYKKVPLIAASHHEYLDGSGYPRGIDTTQIPFMSKILTVADIFEALTADRHYRPKMSTAEALAILDKDAGKKFDTHILEALKQYLLSLGCL